MSLADDLLIAYRDLNWENYIAISDLIVKVKKDDLDRDLIDQASLYSYYSGLKALSQKELDKAQLRLSQLVSTLRKDELERRTKQGLKVTDKTLEAFYPQ